MVKTFIFLKIATEISLLTILPLGTGALNQSSRNGPQCVEPNDHLPSQSQSAWLSCPLPHARVSHSPSCPGRAGSPQASGLHSPR